MTTYVILLRGVMPAGRNRVSMSALRTALADAGMRNVRTYIQSGNVIAETRLGRIALQSLVRETIARELGPELAVFARTHEQIGRVLGRNPFPRDHASRTYFSLLADEPGAALMQEFRGIDFSPDAVKVAGDTVYTLYATKHGDSKFTNNFFERKLKVVATTRNFNTLSRLLELSA